MVAPTESGRSFLRVTTRKLGENRGTPRLYIDGRYLLDAGFSCGRRIAIEVSPGAVRIDLDDNGAKRISGKAGGTIPVIDIENRQLAEALRSAEAIEVRVAWGRITITPARTARRRSERRLTRAAVSLFAGGGLLSQAARSAGFNPVAAVEIEPAFADIYQANHGGRMFNASIEEVDFAEIAALGPIGLLEAGIPCEPFSRIRRLDRGGQEKRNKALPPESHELGDLFFWALKAVDEINPHTIVIEEVADFLRSGAGYICLHALARMGYTVDSRVIDSRDYGELTSRKRAVIVATTHNGVIWPEPCATPRSMAEVLLPPDHPDCEWWDEQSPQGWAIKHWRRQTAKGNGFAPPVIRAEDTGCGVIKKRYFAGQGDNPVVGHPDRPGVYRWLTLGEVKAIMGLPANYDLGTTKTHAGEVMGQGVVVGVFERIIRSVTRIDALPDSLAA